MNNWDEEIDLGDFVFVRINHIEIDNGSLEGHLVIETRDDDGDHSIFIKAEQMNKLVDYWKRLTASLKAEHEGSDKSGAW